MEKQITDDEDRLKRQARRRLIGAVALTTAIVVILPMVLENEPKPVGQDIELRIPDKDKAGAFTSKIDSPHAVSAPVATLPVTPTDAASAPVIASNPVPEAVAAVPAPQPVPVPKPAPAVIVPEVHSAPVPVKTVVTEPEHKPSQVNTDQLKAEQVKLDQAKSDHDKLASGGHPEQVGAAPKAGLALQIGAFGNADTAHSWQKNLIQQGFKAYTEKVGNKVRVRIGPYSTRDAANKARHKLEDKGLHCNIVDLE